MLGDDRLDEAYRFVTPFHGFPYCKSGPTAERRGETHPMSAQIACVRQHGDRAVIPEDD
jgi:hypothetical protein